MNSKPKSIDMGSLIQKVTKRARELLKKKSANGTSRYSKSKRQKLLIGGVSVNIDSSRDAITNILDRKTPTNNDGRAHLVHLLKLQTIITINERYQNLLEKFVDLPEANITEEKKTQEEEILKILEIIESKLKVDELKVISDDIEYVPNIENTYEYEIFDGELDLYKKYKLDKDIIALNIFKMFKELLLIDNETFNNDVFNGGNINGGGIMEDTQNKSYHEKLVTLQRRVLVYKEAINKSRANFVGLKIMEPKIKKGDSLDTVTTIAAAVEEDLLGNNFTETIKDLERDKFNKLLNDIRNGGKLFSIKVGPAKTSGLMSRKLEAYDWPSDGSVSATPFYIYNITYNNQTNVYNLIPIFQINREGKDDYNIITTNIGIIEKRLNELISKYQGITNGTTGIDQTFNNLYIEIRVLIKDIKEKYGYLSQKYPQYKPEAVLNEGSQLIANPLEVASQGGGNPVKYKSTGQVVHIMFQNKKYKRVIYVKEKRNTKYCKMNNEYILLSKLKVIE